MADLETFRKKVRGYYRQIYHKDGKTKYTQQDLADLIPMNEDELGKRLNGYRDEKTGRIWQLTEENVLDIVLRLAELQALTWEQAVELLTLMDYPSDPSQWKTRLQKYLSPPGHSPFPVSKKTPLATVPDAPERNHRLQPRRHIFQVRDLPKEYVLRSNVFNEVKRLLLNHEGHQTTAITTALRGAGGFGKTTLALALCHDPDIQEAFPDGILWKELGEHPPEPLTVLNDLLHVLDPSEREALTLKEVRERWQHALEKRSYLLVIDDVWHTEAMEELLQGGPRCGRLVTTRNDQLLPETVTRVWVDAMEPAEAMALLCEGVIDEWQHILDPSMLEQVVAQQLGCWPLLVSLARGLLLNQVKRLGKTPEQALALIQQAYQDRGMTAFHLGDRDERQRNVNACLEVNLRQLEEWVPAHYQTRQRYLELAVFPEDTDIPLSTLQIYWKGSGGLHEYEVEELCLHLSDLSLLLPRDTEHPTIRLHDVLRSYLIQRVGKHLPSLHQRLLDVHQQHYHLTRWADLPQSEAYLWERLVFHICQAGYQDILQTTLTDLRFLSEKALYVGVSALEADLLLASRLQQANTHAPVQDPFESLYHNIMHISHLLRQAQTLAEMSGLLLSYLDGEPAIIQHQLLLEQDLPRPFLTAWYSLLNKSSTLLRTLHGHTSVVHTCMVSLDGRFIVSASWDKTLKVWDATTGAERLTLEGHTGPVNGCAFSPDGKWIVSASDDVTLKVWDATTGAERLTLEGHTGKVQSCAVSNDGCFIVSASQDRTLKVWDATTGAERLTLEGHTDKVQSCAVSNDGCFIVSASEDETLKVWDATTGAERLILKGHANVVNGCAFSPDGKWIASSSMDKTLKVWDATTGAERLTLEGHTGPVNGCAFSPDGKWIVSASSDNTLKVWDATTGAERFTLEGHTNWVQNCVVSDDGRFIISASWDKTLKVWDAATGTEYHSPRGGMNAVKSCAVSPDGSYIVSAINDGTLKVWDARTGAERLTLKGHTDHGWVTIINSCAVSPDGSYIVSAADDKTLKVWDSATGAERLTLKGHFRNVSSCVVSGDGRFIISASWDKTLKVWDAATGTELRTLKGHADAIHSCAVSPDGSYIVSATDDSILKVWDANSGAERFTLKGHIREVYDCAVSGDGRFIVSASWDKTLKVWDAATGTELRTLRGHAAAIRSCAMSPDGKWIVSASEDSTLKLWNMQSGLCVLTYPVDGVLRRCAFHPDGEHLVACGDAGMYFLRLVQ